MNTNQDYLFLQLEDKLSLLYYRLFIYTFIADPSSANNTYNGVDANGDLIQCDVLLIKIPY